MPCNTCGTSIPAKTNNCPKKCPTPCPPKPVPDCRKSSRDFCRIKPVAICKKCCYCPPKKCVRKTKCKLPSIKDKCRTDKPCNECCPSECCTCDSC